jgi:hypothetical protein
LIVICPADSCALNNSSYNMLHNTCIVLYSVHTSVLLQVALYNMLQGGNPHEAAKKLLAKGRQIAIIEPFNKLMAGMRQWNDKCNMQHSEVLHDIAMAGVTGGQNHKPQKSLMGFCCWQSPQMEGSGCVFYSRHRMFDSSMHCTTLKQLCTICRWRAGCAC